MATAVSAAGHVGRRVSRIAVVRVETTVSARAAGARRGRRGSARECGARRRRGRWLVSWSAAGRCGARARAARGWHRVTQEGQGERSGCQAASNLMARRIAARYARPRSGTGTACPTPAAAWPGTGRSAGHGRRTARERLELLRAPPAPPRGPAGALSSSRLPHARHQQRVPVRQHDDGRAEPDRVVMPRARTAW